MKVFNLTLALCLAALVSANGTTAASSDFALLLDTGARRFPGIPSSTQPDTNGKWESITDDLYKNASRLLALFESLVSPAVEHDEDDRTATGFLQLVADDRAAGMDDEAVLDHLMQKIDDVLLEETDMEESTGDNETNNNINDTNHHNANYNDSDYHKWTHNDRDDNECTYNYKHTHSHIDIHNFHEYHRRFYFASFIHCGRDTGRNS
ncbi:UNVERIFIED_CONTAM: hypothetical protein HHA_209930 [Hammondia hammondi]|eukprot:XP_008886953.1 hypothetical protein HHA_209930 [Hammondia hammondi]